MWLICFCKEKLNQIVLYLIWNIAIALQIQLQARKCMALGTNKVFLDAPIFL